MDENEKDQQGSGSDDEGQNPEIIHSYSRQDALNDGVFVDVSEWAREVGFVFPVAFTCGLWEEIEAKHEYESARGRGHDILSLAKIAARKAPDNESMVEFTVRFTESDKKLWMVIETDSSGMPGLTIMRPEDY